jgi:hypothetical protein
MTIGSVNLVIGIGSYWRSWSNLSGTHGIGAVEEVERIVDAVSELFTLHNARLK